MLGFGSNMQHVTWMLRRMGQQGGVPELEEMVAVRNAMVRETDLRQPMDLGQQLLHSSGLADDVGQAMVNLLQVLSHLPSEKQDHGESQDSWEAWAFKCPAWWKCHTCLQCCAS